MNWFYRTKIGEWYFEFLLWLDRYQERRSTKYLTPKEISQVIRQYSLLSEGVIEVKRKINTLIVCKNKEEYNKILTEIENMVELAERGRNSPQAKLAEVLKEIYVKKNSKDIITATDMAKMIRDRLEDYEQLHEHIRKRELMREIRKQKKEGNNKHALELEQEFKGKYGTRCK